MAGAEELTMEMTEHSSLKHLREQLEAVIPFMTTQKQSFRIAVNQQFIDKDVPLYDGDEVAFLPPFSGG